MFPAAAEKLAMIERALDEAIGFARPEALYAAMRHAVGAGGKRIRPLVCLAAAEAVGGKAADALGPACAIELIHNYTLVHDDLPSMDGDRERRGQPSVWVKFGEANAVLAGDALLARAFGAAAKAPHNAGKIVETLSEAGVGVVRGQVEDIARAQGGIVDPRDVEFVYLHKTADLFIAAAVMGAYAGGGSEDDAEKLRRYALNLGLAFQYEDDLLDGDSPFSDVDTKALIQEHTAAALGALDGLRGDVSFLAQLARELAGRKM